MKTILLLSIFLFTSNCEKKPEKIFFGIPEEERATILLGLLNSNNLEYTSYGTVRDPKTRLEWKRCSQGQVFRQTEQDCQGTTSQSGITTSPQTGITTGNLDISAFGAIKLTYCSKPSNDCNTSALPPALILNTVNNSISGAYISCASESLGSATNWRVPSTPELLGVASLGRIALLKVFPNQQENYYWSSWSNEQDLTGRTARAVSFYIDTYGKESLWTKDSYFYVRCVRNY
ncbi:MAG: DUF1566 domain-containing protein [Leptospiraceae bacterium]|nr:DUF1566 domain-containing protein [Leptospiraceae bacterium]